ncbi:MAG: hypothetical protein K8U03_06615 [Planctomycetia bacterium]|nr:hypothetical protein [Planctomycetia bacterium]
MRCDFRPTGESNARGLPKLRCSRAGCSNVCFSHHPPQAIRFQCKHPALFELGEFTAKAIKTATLGRVREKPGCGCERRRKSLNRWLSIAMPNRWYRWYESVRTWLANHMTFKKPTRS